MPSAARGGGVLLTTRGWLSRLDKGLFSLSHTNGGRWDDVVAGCEPLQVFPMGNAQLWRWTACLPASCSACESYETYSTQQLGDLHFPPVGLMCRRSIGLVQTSRVSRGDWLSDVVGHGWISAQPRAPRARLVH